jgi:DNA-binding PadR family transcriptional regulator
MTSLLGYAILGLLAREPMTGYEVSRRLRRPIGYFWTAQHSQVYTEFARLESGGSVRHVVVDGPGPRDTKRYAITAEGRTSLASWVVTDPKPAPAKSDLLLRVYSIWLADRGAALAMLHRVRDEHQGILEGYRATLGRGRHDLVGPHSGQTPGPGLADPEFGDIAALMAGVGYEESTIGWLNWLCTALDRAGESDPPTDRVG